VYDYIIELFRTQAEVILNHVIPNVRGIGEGEAMQRNIRNFNLAADRPTTFHLANRSVREVT
jgi:hypothetical protein